MRQTIVLGFMLAAALPAAAGGLTATETRWLRGAAPVLADAEARGLPLDIVVQPQPTTGLALLALGFVDGRCKFVLSMRANPEAEATLERLPPGREDAALELMAAHEVAHCERHVQGAWHGRPPGAGAGPDPERGEEAWADLAGLAWIQARRPADYAALHACWWPNASATACPAARTTRWTGWMPPPAGWMRRHRRPLRRRSGRASRPRRAEGIQRRRPRRR